MSGDLTKEEQEQKRIKDIVAGFRIVDMTIRDADNGSFLWGSSNWEKAFDEEIKVELPKKLLQCRAVSREMVFSSQQLIPEFRLVQNVLLHGHAIEEWRFRFGFVIPQSTNSWQCVIEAAAQEQMVSAETLSGNVVIETSFYDGSTLVNKSKIRVFYV